MPGISFPTLRRSSSRKAWLSTPLVQRDEYNSNRDGSRSISSSARAGLTLGLIVGALLISLVLTFMLMRMKHGRSFTLRSLFSRRKKLAGSCTSTRQLCKEDFAPTPSALTVATVTSTATLGKPLPPLDKGLEILGLQTDPWKPNPPRNRHQQQRSRPLPQPPLPPSPPDSSCTLNQVASRSPMIMLPVVQEEHDAATARSYETCHPHSPLLPPPPTLSLLLHRSPPPTRPLPAVPALPHGSAEDICPLSPTPSRLTATTRSSGAFPWGFELRAVEDVDVPIADTLSDDQVLVLPSPPRMVHFSARARARARAGL